jgi:voltage-dependent calcium channel L type alpha-1D
MTLCVLINTVALAVDRYNIPTDQNDILTKINEILTYIFIGELGLKLFVLGPINYLRDKMNYLDAGVVLLSIIEMTVLNQGGTGKKTSFNAFRSVRIFRTFRVLRVARLLKGMKSMQLIVAVIA